MKRKNTQSVAQDAEPSPQESAPPHETASADNGRACRRKWWQHARESAESPIDLIVEQFSRENEGTKSPSGNWRQIFLTALARAPIVSVAARIAGVSPEKAFEEQNRDGSFARFCEQATEHGIDEIMAAAYLSAVFGYRKPAYQARKLVGWSEDHSHHMQAMLLQAFRPEVFGKKKEPEQKKMVPMTLEEFRKRALEAEA